MKTAANIMSQHLPHQRKGAFVRGAAAVACPRPCGPQRAAAREDFPHPGEEAV